MRHNALARRPLGAVDGAGPAGSDVAVGDVGHAERLALAVLGADDEALWGLIATTAAVRPSRRLSS